MGNLNIAHIDGGVFNKCVAVSLKSRPLIFLPLTGNIFSLRLIKIHLFLKSPNTTTSPLKNVLLLAQQEPLKSMDMYEFN